MTVKNLELRINDFAARAFRNNADKDYITARMCIRAGLIPQFLWSSLQAFEKYFKYILLVNRIPSNKMGHDLSKSLALIRENVPYVADMKPDNFSAFKQIAMQGEDRYLIDSYAAHGHILPELDAAIWDVRRYCQVLLPNREPTESESKAFASSLDAIVKSRLSPSRLKIAGGFLEKVVADRHHFAHSALCWQNAFFGTRSRTHVKARFYLEAENAPLLLYPDMIEVLSGLIRIPDGSRKAYVQYAEDLKTGEAERF